MCLCCKIYYIAGEVNSVLRDLNQADVQKLSPVSKYCQCVKYSCGCCILINVEELKLINATG